MQVQQSFADESKPCLYVCSTPIGNLQDVTLRLLTVLREADVIAAEDTRQTRKLLTHFDIHPELLVSYHQHNEQSRQEDLVNWWNEGKHIALVSDAGTPAISDPGFEAVRLAQSEGVRVIPIPGPSAVTTALVASGIVPQPFLYLGFLPREPRAQRELLNKYTRVDATLVFYEAPHRVLATLKNLEADYHERTVTLARELTKKHETFVRGTLSEAKEYLHANGARGEFVVVVGPPATDGVSADESAESEEDKWDCAVAMVQERLQAGWSHKEAVAVTAKEIGVKRRDLYQATLGSPKE